MVREICRKASKTNAQWTPTDIRDSPRNIREIRDCNFIITVKLPHERDDSFYKSVNASQDGRSRQYGVAYSAPHPSTSCARARTRYVYPPLALPPGLFKGVFLFSGRKVALHEQSKSQAWPFLFWIPFPHPPNKTTTAVQTANPPYPTRHSRTFLWST